MTDDVSGLTMLTAFRRSVVADPSAVAIRHLDSGISRSELDALSDRLAGGLVTSGVAPGDRVMLALDNTPAFIVAVLATWKLGGVVVPVDPALGSGDLRSKLEDTTPRVLFAHPASAAAAAASHPVTRPLVVWSTPSDLMGDAPDPHPTGASVPSMLAPPGAFEVSAAPATSSDPALLGYTSGTTGVARAVVLSHANLVHQVTSTADALGIGRSGVALATVPFFQVTGFVMQAMVALARGLTLVLVAGSESERVLGQIVRYRPRFLVGPLSSFLGMAGLASEDEAGRVAISELRLPIATGELVATAVVEQHENDFGPRIVNGYGLAETASLCIAVPAGEVAPADPGSGAISIGRPLPGVTVTIVSDDGSEAPRGRGGEIVVHGPQAASGYWDRVQETAEVFRHDGVHTGDVGMIDDEGWIHLVDRKDDLIVVSGYQVWPRDVEDVLRAHPAVAEAAVIGDPDDRRGQSVHAYVVLRHDRIVTTQELNRHCREYLSAPKRPSDFEIVDALPKSPSGTILRRRLRTQSRVG